MTTATMFRRLPTVAEMHAHPQAVPKGPKGTSRLDVKTAKVKADFGKLDAWKRDVVRLDGYRCRKCGVKVIRTTALVPNRADAHHVSRRAEKIVRTDVRNGICLCATCHGQVTGKVAEKWIVVGTVYFTISGRSFINARERVTFQRIA